MGPFEVVQHEHLAEGPQVDLKAAGQDMLKSLLVGDYHTVALAIPN